MSKCQVLTCNTWWHPFRWYFNDPCPRQQDEMMIMKCLISHSNFKKWHIKLLICLLLAVQSHSCEDCGLLLFQRSMEELTTIGGKCTQFPMPSCKHSVHTKNTLAKRWKKTNIHATTIKTVVPYFEKIHKQHTQLLMCQIIDKFRQGYLFYSKREKSSL